MKNDTSVIMPAALNASVWMSLFKPVDNASGDEYGLTIDDRNCIMHDHRNEDDFDAIKEADPSTVWTVIEGESGNWYIVNGMHVVNRVGYLVTRIGIEEGSIEVPVFADNDNDDLGFVANDDPDDVPCCEHGCQSFCGQPVLAYIDEQRFSHFYCRYCGNTCS